MADLIFTTGSVCFSLALLPMVLGPHKPSRSSAALTAFWLWAFAVTYATLGLSFGAASTAVSAALWTTLCAQAHALRRKGSG